MTIDDYRNYCLSKPKVTEHLPFNNDVLVFKVCDKMFALASLTKWEHQEGYINLKCDPEYAQELREDFEGITPGYHMHKRLWNSVAIHNSDVEIALIYRLIDHSYDQVVKGLPKKLRDCFK